METTEIESTRYHINILNFQHFLREIWRSDKDRDWKIYSHEQFRRFWDIRTVEPRSK